MAKKAASKRKAAATPVETIRHQDTRKNIPTEELRDFVRDEEHAPRTMLYPRDPTLDPQLVWKGKDEQDQMDLAIPVVPIYIQEKIHPQAIIDDLVASAALHGLTSMARQLDFFADFNGLEDDFNRKIEFYQHDQHWQNRMILGDSLLVMTSLAEKEGLKGKVQTIYFDPPYGIKFGSNWQVSTRKRDVKDGKAEDATRQPEQVRAFRDTWKLGIHSYLAYLRDRLVAARELLTDSGSVFVQIGDENVHLVRCMMDEVFGSENSCAVLVCRKTSNLNSPLARVNVIPGSADFILWYAKDVELAKDKYRQLYIEKSLSGEGGDHYRTVELDDGTIRSITREEIADSNLLPTKCRVVQIDNLISQGFSESLSQAFSFRGRNFSPGHTSHWKTTISGLTTLAVAGRLVDAGKTLRYKRYFDDFPVMMVNSIWEDVGADPDKSYVVQTPSAAIQRCILMTTDPGDLVLDPTCGSGTTAYVAEQWGRRWITCDTSRVALALARTRLMAAKFPYYYMADNYPGWTQYVDDSEMKAYLRKTAPSAHAGGSLSEPSASAGGDVRKGFVYKRVPHVTVKSIANNPDIQEGMSRAEIDAAIARHAETETLFDQPYPDNTRVRVSGPFTVESLSPHRTISVEEKKRLAEVGTPSGVTVRVMGPTNFANMILDNLRKAGVQNTVKGERLKFDSLEPYAGEWIHGDGRYTESPSEPPASAEGVKRRAAICIGPEHGTVGSQLVKEAAKEAVKGVGFDVLIVCGFAFDPSVSEEAKRYGKLTVLPTRMNPDLAMGDDLLKKTGAGNLFMVFGEPDLVIKKLPSSPPRQQGEELVAEIKGVDVYDPTTGEIRSSSTDDIACWFIDTAYNGESFFVRHADFTGADEPYDKLKRALRAEIDEAAWSSLYSTTSRPFPKPETGKIAVKVINHYGDEVLKVYEA